MWKGIIRMRPTLVGSRPRAAELYLADAWQLLLRGGSALDAVELATRWVEEDLTDRTVGLGGRPNKDGIVELDAGIMDGSTRKFGAVGGLRGYSQAISVARRVLERLPHLLVVGQGAETLARELGLESKQLLTPGTEEEWRRWLAETSRESVSDPSLNEHRAGTINVLGLDGNGHLAATASTSGWAWKFPGRIGDSAIIGAGLFADDRAGAAACTGFGEASMFSGTARRAVECLADGMTAEQSCLRAAAKLSDVPTFEIEDKGRFPMSIVVLSADGSHCGASTDENQHYATWTPDGFKLLPRIKIKIE